MIGSVAVRYEADDVALVVVRGREAHFAVDLAPQPRLDLAEFLRLVVELGQTADLDRAVVVGRRRRLAEHVEEAEETLLGAAAGLVGAGDRSGVFLRIGRRRVVRLAPGAGSSDP